MINIKKYFMASALLLFGITTANAIPSIYPTGVTLYKHDKAYNTDILYTASDLNTYLINMQGKVIHQWNYLGFPAIMLDPKLNPGKCGHLLLQTEQIPTALQDPLASIENGLGNKSIGEVDWQGHIIWQWGKQAPDGAAHQSHDISQLPNGDILFLRSQKKSLKGFKINPVIDDVLYEINPVSGKIVWSWSASDHLSQFGFSAKQLALVKNSHDPYYLHFNVAVPLGENSWYTHGDQRFAPNNILVSSRWGNFIAIIDKVTGNIVWRLGPNLPQLNAKMIGTVPRPVDQFIGQHAPHMIAEGLKGAGDIIMLDDRGFAGFPAAPHNEMSGSRVIEINPVTKQIVWEYSAYNSHQQLWTFSTQLLGSARRLKNGNTLIDEGEDGRMFQVTPSGEIVWEYITPYKGKAFTMGNTWAKATQTQVYRAIPIDKSWLPINHKCPINR